MKVEIISETPITMSQLKEELDIIKKRDKELGLRSQKTEEYLQRFVKLENRKAKELYKKIEELNIPRMRAEIITKIVDLLPENTEDLKTILQGYTITITAENMKKISDVIASFK